MAVVKKGADANAESNARLRSANRPQRRRRGLAAINWTTEDDLISFDSDECGLSFVESDDSIECGISSRPRRRRLAATTTNAEDDLSIFDPDSNGHNLGVRLSPTATIRRKRQNIVGARSAREKVAKEKTDEAPADNAAKDQAKALKKAESRKKENETAKRKRAEVKTTVADALNATTEIAQPVIATAPSASPVNATTSGAQPVNTTAPSAQPVNATTESAHSVIATAPSSPPVNATKEIAQPAVIQKEKEMATCSDPFASVLEVKRIFKIIYSSMKELGFVFTPEQKSALLAKVSDKLKIEIEMSDSEDESHPKKHAKLSNEPVDRFTNPAPSGSMPTADSLINNPIVGAKRKTADDAAIKGDSSVKKPRKDDIVESDAEVDEEEKTEAKSKTTKEVEVQAAVEEEDPEVTAKKQKGERSSKWHFKREGGPNCDTMTVTLRCSRKRTTFHMSMNERYS